MQTLGWMILEALNLLKMVSTLLPLLLAHLGNDLKWQLSVVIVTGAHPSLMRTSYFGYPTSLHFIPVKFGGMDNQLESLKSRLIFFFFFGIRFCKTNLNQALSILDFISFFLMEP